jgi:hypothetical protein
VESTGIRFCRDDGKANFDYRHTHDLQERRDLPDADQKVNLLRTRFAETIPDQHQCIQQILRGTPTDLVLVDTMFFGSFPMLLGPRQKRPPVIGCGVNPMMLSSRDCGTIAPPANTPEGRKQVLQDKQRIQVTFQPIDDSINSVMRPYGIPPMPDFFLDCMYLLPDIFLQFTAKALEFSRSDMPDTVRCIGPILPGRSVEFDEPDWWTELDGSRPVVLVTQRHTSES